MIEIVQLLLDRYLLQICLQLNNQFFEHSFCDIFEIRFYVELYLHVLSKVDFIFGESVRKCKLTQPWLVQADMPLSRTQSLRNHGTRLRENPKSYCERPLLYFCRFHSTNFTTGSVVTMKSPTTNMVWEKRVNQIISLGRKVVVHFLSAWGNLKEDKVGWTYYRP